MMAERKAGHWADPSVDDDRHDRQSLFGRGDAPQGEEDDEAGRQNGQEAGE